MAEAGSGLASTARCIEPVEARGVGARLSGSGPACARSLGGGLSSDVMPSDDG
jgi:hypothetical protein